MFCGDLATMDIAIMAVRACASCSGLPPCELTKGVVVNNTLAREIIKPSGVNSPHHYTELQIIFFQVLPEERAPIASATCWGGIEPGA